MQFEEALPYTVYLVPISIYHLSTLAWERKSRKKPLELAG